MTTILLMPCKLQKKKKKKKINFRRHMYLQAKKMASKILLQKCCFS